MDSAAFEVPLFAPANFWWNHDIGLSFLEVLSAEER